MEVVVNFSQHFDTITGLTEVFNVLRTITAPPEGWVKESWQLVCELGWQTYKHFGKLAINMVDKNTVQTFLYMKNNSFYN